MPPKRERLRHLPQAPEPEQSYKITGQPIPQPVYYQNKLIGWRVAGEEAIYPATAYRRSRLFSKI